MKIFLEILTITAIALAALFIMIYVVEKTYGPWQCGNISKMTGRDVKYITFDGCYVEHNGEFIPKDRFIGITGE